ncbi:YhjD/YihY/BrkB family envelope integrity protein [Anaerobaca lacustris]|uniref:YhjD/YihY/BrkB family envelope integrity protein n=1 Tax=Anaerobaca lacustris TaxID=3044600 RepID=A0AAW6TYP4_9BACT|nr:YhjD/YihY/BrkB family envelope integrity protein [Sedimentisphaerales bacterium M17dextr]
MKLLRDLSTTPTAQLGRASRFLVFQIKLWSHCIRLLKRNRAAQQAAALSYYTIFGLVPLAIVVLLIFQSFPAYQDIGDRLKLFAYEQLHLTKIEYSQDEEDPDQKVMLTDYLDGIIGRFFGGIDSKSLSLLSAVLVIWAALALLSTIERAFNHIWHVSRGRSFLHRMINYWALLTLGPLLVGVGIYVTTQYAAIRDIETTVLAYRVVPLILSYLLSLLAFFLLYFVLPSTKVNPAAALWGAAVAALVWSFAKHGFSTYVTQFIPYSKIYGVLGLIPLSVFWIHITWLIALFGLQLTYTTQHLKTLDAAEIESSKGGKQEYFITNDLTVINIAREIARTFARDEGPLSCEALCNRLRLPLELGDDILDYLVKAKLLVKTSEPEVGFVPARDPEHITLSEITEALAAAALAQPDLNEPEMLGRLVQAQRRFLARHSLREILQAEPLDEGIPGDGPERPAS